jgi:hypothetical protein
MLLYDLAGFDGLPLAKALFGDRIDRIAPFQSLEVNLKAESDLTCSVLRLCQNNFRIRIGSQAASVLETQFAQMQRQQRVWLKPFPWLGVLSLTDEDTIAQLSRLVTPKAPHRIVGLQLNCAAVGRISGISVLVWRHTVQDQSLVELHLATQNLETIKAFLSETGMTSSAA